MPHPQNQQQDDTHEIDGSRFRAIQVEQDESASAQNHVEDDEEIIDIGAPRLSNTHSKKPQGLEQQAGSQDYRQPSQAGRSKDVRSRSSNRKESSAQAGSGQDRDYPRQESHLPDATDTKSFEDRDFGVEDLQPMPLIQKIILFVAILAIVFVGYKLVCYWIGI